MADFRSAFLLLLLACMWSSSFTSIKFVVDAIAPLSLVALRLTIASVILVGFVKMRGYELPAIGKAWVPYFLIGITGNSLPFFLISWGETGTSSAQASILMALMPLATLIIAHFFTESDKITGPKLVGLIIGFAGVILLFGPAADHTQSGPPLFSVAIACAALCYAIAAVQVRRLPKQKTPIIGSAVMMICASAQMIPFSVLVDQPWTLGPTDEQLLVALYLGIVPTGLAAILYIHIITEKGTTFFALINYIIPCLGVLWGYLFLGENVGVAGLLALAIILTGIAIANVKRREKT